jgi:hypothetical protein
VFQALRSSAWPFSRISDRLLQAWTLRKTSLLRDRSNGDAVKASADNFCTSSQARRPASPFEELRRRAHARVQGECAPSRILAQAGLERSPLHDVRQHAPKATRGRTRLGNLRMRIDEVRTDALLDESHLLPMQQCKIGRQKRAAQGAHPASERSRSIAGLVEPDGIEPTTSCLQSRRSPS